MASPLVVLGIGVLGTAVVGATSVGAYYLFSGSEEKKGEAVEGGSESETRQGGETQEERSGGGSSAVDAGNVASQPSNDGTDGQRGEGASTSGSPSVPAVGNGVQGQDTVVGQQLGGTSGGGNTVSDVSSTSNSGTVGGSQ
ncbi:hypothetical protein [Candidatus Mycoplasma haematohominis]|uniref:Uncharacterized protein n=1 Tax=Candidatus Mycoplasma haematohominis TaxID=1494318 RepID=A0A478FRP3_9MOLU|nr:hypothetical protein [Candidatus Mycoplasma haemohominis]GCE63099.1 hypothetical protein MHSWG343_00770 [Candidatus Mycoplasma haemohominis]